MSNGTDIHVLIFNAGSSSLKFELFAKRPGLTSCFRGAVKDIGKERPVFQTEDSDPERIRVSGHAEAAGLILDRICGAAAGNSTSIDRIAATGHRVVHGGDRFSVPTTVTAEVMDRLRALTPLAPLHNPASLAVMEVVRERLAGVPMAAVFDTSFFRTMPDPAKQYAVPASWYRDHGVHRFGFHGVAHQYLYERFTVLRGTDRRVNRVVSLHLGQGCSATALLNGSPVETSMGFTPIEGLIMGTRAGDLDAGAVLHIARQGISWPEIEEALNRKSGLLGLSGVSSDVRELLALEDTGHAGATFALAAFHHRIRKYLGAYTAVLGGLDAILFGGGIGENAPRIRARICAGFEWLGLELDEEANSCCVEREGQLSKATSAIDVRVIPVREEEAIARAVLALLELR